MAEAPPGGQPLEGSGPGDLLALQPQPIQLAAIVDRVRGPGFGAIATFSGTVRDAFRGRRVLHLEYEAYAGMALRVMGEIAAELRRRLEIGSVAIVHRTGRLEVGEISVVVAVSAPHRRAALEACDLAVERVKASLPVWKKEFYEGGEVWRENDPRSGILPGAESARDRQRAGPEEP